MRALGLVTIVCLVAGLATATVLGGLALADCISPNIRFEPVVVSRGQAVRIVGQAFGDECFDAGVPDGATGELGEPQQNIRILIVQGGEEHPVGEVDADDDYEFAIDIVVPDSVQSGDARVVARLVDGVDIGAFDSGGAPVPALRIIDADPSATSTTTVARDSSPSTARQTSVAESSSDESFPTGLAVAGAAITAVLIATFLLSRRRRRATP